MAIPPHIQLFMFETSQRLLTGTFKQNLPCGIRKGYLLRKGITSDRGNDNIDDDSSTQRSRSDEP